MSEALGAISVRACRLQFMNAVEQEILFTLDDILIARRKKHEVLE